MPREYTKIKKALMRKGTDEVKAKQMASIIFYKQYGISVKEAHELDEQGKWSAYKRKHAVFKKKQEKKKKSIGRGWHGDTSGHSFASKQGWKGRKMYKGGKRV